MLVTLLLLLLLLLMLMLLTLSLFALALLAVVVGARVHTCLRLHTVSEWQQSNTSMTRTPEGMHSRAVRSCLSVTISARSTAPSGTSASMRPSGSKGVACVAMNAP